MSPQDYHLRPLHWSDLPALKRWRQIPDVRRHLRNPRLNWLQHILWFLGRPTVWAVTLNGVLVGQAGWYYRTGTGAEVSILIVIDGYEDYGAERLVVSGLLAAKARAHGLTHFWAEVLATAPLYRHHAVSLGPSVGDGYSTLYRWSLL